MNIPHDIKLQNIKLMILSLNYQKMCILFLLILLLYN